MKPLVTAAAVLVALVVSAPVQAQTPEIDALRARAEQGDASAQHNLGVMHDYGQGVPQDDAEAARWYRLAADQGLALAQVNLGVRYENGRGVPQDYIEAHMWFNLAVAQSSGKDRNRWVRSRDIIAAKMTAEQIAEAQRRARVWDAAHPREPHCTPGQPAVGSASTPRSPEERRMKPLVAAVLTPEVIDPDVRARGVALDSAAGAGRLTPGESNDATLTGIGTSVAPA